MKTLPYICSKDETLMMLTNASCLKRTKMERTRCYNCKGPVYSKLPIESVLNDLAGKLFDEKGERIENEKT